MQGGETNIGLYHLSLVKSNVVTASCVGCFVSKAQDIVVAHHDTLAMYRIERNGESLSLVCRTPMFSIITAVAPYRAAGMTLDHLFVTCDSGKLVYLKFDASVGTFVTISTVTFGKSGLRRIVPGHYLAVDPGGRAVFVAALEKQKFVFPLRVEKGETLVGSAIEAHNVHTIVYAVATLETGTANPIFACIEQEYDDGVVDLVATSKRNLVHYEYDLGLNHVVKSCSYTVPPTANYLVALPGGNEGPGGVLVCAVNYVMWIHKDDAVIKTIRCAIPRRSSLAYDHPLMMVSSAVIRRHTADTQNLVLLQSEQGDLYNLVIDWNLSRGLQNLICRYYDTVPVANSMVLLRRGFLVLFGEASAHYVYKILSLGRDDDSYITGLLNIEKKSTSTAPDAASHEAPAATVESFPLFKHSEDLQLLKLTDRINSLAPLNSMRVVTLNEGARDASSRSIGVVVAHGRGPTSSLSLIQYGVNTSPMGERAFDGAVERVWTVRQPLPNRPGVPLIDTMIVVSGSSWTMVLKADEHAQPLEGHANLLLNSRTIAVGAMGVDGTLVQVCPDVIRVVSPNNASLEWRHEHRKLIIHAKINQRQCIVAFAGGGIAYFQLDSANRLIQHNIESTNEVSCLALMNTPTDAPLAPFAGVGFSAQREFSIFSLARAGTVSQLFASATGTIRCNSEPQSCLISALAPQKLFAFVGLADGNLAVVSIDHNTGSFFGTVESFQCGLAPCRVIAGDGATHCFASSTRLFKCVYSESTCHATTIPVALPASATATIPAPGLAPQSYDVCTYTSPRCHGGIIVLKGQSLHFMRLDNSTERHFIESLSLFVTPRRFVKLPNSPLVVVAESQNRAPIDDPAAESQKDGIGRNGQWISRLRSVDLSRICKGSQKDPTVEIRPTLLKSEAIVSLCATTFAERGSELFVVAGLVENFKPCPISYDSASLMIYSVRNGAFELSFAKPTILDKVPYCLCGYEGKLLVGCGDTLRLYNLGKSQLLKKTERGGFPSAIVSIQVSGNRIIVCDQQQSVFFVVVQKNKAGVFEFAIFADDSVPRHITCCCVLDHWTVVVGDKFGNLSVLRLPKHFSEDINDISFLEGQAIELSTDSSLKNQKVVCVACIYVGATVMSVEKVGLAADGGEIVMYATNLGQIGALIPFLNDHELTPAMQLQNVIQARVPGLTGRNHQQMRSYYYPMVRVVDGDFCESFLSLPATTKKEVAEDVAELLRTVVVEGEPKYPETTDPVGQLTMLLHTLRGRTINI